MKSEVLNVWREFASLSEALQLASSYQQRDVHVFSCEYPSKSSNKGARYFIVASLEHFWSRYIQLPLNRRNHYEVIRKESPCRLYFDIEYDKRCNLTVDSEYMMQQLKIFVVSYLCKMFTALENRMCVKKYMVDLDSSTLSKFSRHVICHLPHRHAFANNFEAGVFVKRMMADLETMPFGKLLSKGLEDVFVYSERDEVDSVRSVVDLSVYSLNRNFRIYLSTKKGKEAPLVLARCHEGGRFDRLPPDLRDSTVFENSLVTRVKPTDPVLSFSGIPSLEPYLPVKHDYVDIQPHVARSDDRRQASQRLDDQPCFGSSNQQSKYPAIDQFISDYVRRNSTTGMVRRVTHLSASPHVIVYGIYGWRYCHRIGREHKSNQIMLVVNLKMGVFYQKCHDVDCRGFRSEQWLLPAEIVDGLDVDLL